jgi:hypothetical protein
VGAKVGYFWEMQIEQLCRPYCKKLLNLLITMFFETPGGLLSGRDGNGGQGL